MSKKERPFPHSCSTSNAWLSSILPGLKSLFSKKGRGEDFEGASRRCSCFPSDGTKAKILSPMDSVRDLPAALVEAGSCYGAGVDHTGTTGTFTLDRESVLTGAIRAAASIMTRFIDDSLVQLSGSRMLSCIVLSSPCS